MFDDELQAKFTTYIESFKEQSINVKRSEIINSLKELITVLDIVSQKEGIDIEYLKSREIADIENEEVPEDDFLEACLVYVENVKGMISKYLIEKDLL